MSNGSVRIIACFSTKNVAVGLSLRSMLDVSGCSLCTSCRLQLPQVDKTVLCVISAVKLDDFLALHVASIVELHMSATAMKLLDGWACFKSARVGCCCPPRYNRAAVGSCWRLLRVVCVCFRLSLHVHTARCTRLTVNCRVRHIELGREWTAQRVKLTENEANCCGGGRLVEAGGAVQ